MIQFATSSKFVLTLWRRNHAQFNVGGCVEKLWLFYYSKLFENRKFLSKPVEIECAIKSRGWIRFCSISIQYSMMIQKWRKHFQSLNVKSSQINFYFYPISSWTRVSRSRIYFENSLTSESPISQLSKDTKIITIAVQFKRF